MRSLTLVWHRHDLRLHDNALYQGLSDDRAVLSVYVFEPASYARLPSIAEPAWDVARTGPHTARVLLAAVDELRSALRARGGELLVRHGDPASILPQLALAHDADEVRWHEEPGTEEMATAARVRSAMRGAGRRVLTEWGCTLYHPDDLPGPDEWAALAHPRRKHQPKKRPAARACVGPSGERAWRERLDSMPRVMGDWRRAVRARAKPRPVLEPPERLRLPAGETPEAGDMPSLAHLMEPVVAVSVGAEGSDGSRPLFGLPAEVVRSIVARALEAPPAAGLSAAGEAAAHARLARFVGGGIAATADRSLADVGLDASSKLSVPLALGCLSPRQVAVAAAAAGDEAAWLASHMEMRDFFVFSALAAGGALFRRDGWRPVAPQPAAAAAWRAPGEAREAWARWATGTIGLPLPDAAMRELLCTGYCSNRVRQNAASALTKDLRIDWRAGAELFQWLLADHEVCANWGNWAYFSGVGADPKQRHFRTVSQQLKYDAAGRYVRAWLPELAGVGDEAALRPHAHAVAGWPEPLVDPATQLSWQDAARLEECGRLICDDADDGQGPAGTTRE